MEKPIAIVEKSKGQGVSLAASPSKLLNDAKRASKALIDVVKQNGWSKKISGHDYLQFEAWQTLAKFYGCTVKTVETKYVQYGGVAGFEAKSVVVDPQGREIGAAEGLCMSDEQNWSGKPLYALKSMAQTRAGAKSLRQVFSWVVVIAGYKPTPAEEMDGIVVEPATANSPAQTRQKSSYGTSGTPAHSETKFEPLTAPQLKYIDQLISQGQLENKDYTKISKKEASKTIESALRVKPGTFKK